MKALLCAGIYYGFVLNVGWVAILTNTYIGFMAFVILCLCIFIHITKKKFMNGDMSVLNARVFTEKNTHKQTLPFWFDFILETGTLAFLYVTGQFWLAGIYAGLQLLCYWLLFMIRAINKLATEIVENSLTRSFSFNDDGSESWDSDVSTTNVWGNDDDDLFRMGIIDSQGDENE
jgi:hypothetical protein